MSTLTIIRAFAVARWSRRFSSPVRLAAHQRRALARHLRFLRRESPYFGAITGEMPVMDKTMMMANFDTMNTVGLRREEALEVALRSERSRDFTPTLHGMSVGLSSGTSGHRGLFVVSPREREEWAGTVLARFLPPGRIWGHRIAFFLRADNNLYQTVGSRIIDFRFFDVYDDETENIRELGNYGPTMLVAPPSVLLMLAAAVERGELDIALLRVIAVAEVLQPGDEAVIASAFGQDIVHQAYQCTEGFLAHTCARGTLHLNEDLIVVEREDVGDGRFVPIITDFRRRSQPIVRYRLNDILRSGAGDCPCGSALATIDRIEGREDDVLLLSARRGGTVRVYSDLIVRSMMWAEGFTEFRIVQTGGAELVVSVDVLNPDVEASVTREIEILADRLGLCPVTLRFERYVVDRSKKLRRVERSLPS